MEVSGSNCRAESLSLSLLSASRKSSNLSVWIGYSPANTKGLAGLKPSMGSFVGCLESVIVSPTANSVRDLRPKDTIPISPHAIFCVAIFWTGWG